MEPTENTPEQPSTVPDLAAGLWPGDTLITEFGKAMVASVETIDVGPGTMIIVRGPAIHGMIRMHAEATVRRAPRKAGATRA